MIHDNNTYACNQCENKYEYKPSLIRHQKVHENPEDLSCTKCSKVLSSKHSLDNHMKVVHENEQTIINFQGMFRTFNDIEVTKTCEKE